MQTERDSRMSTRSKETLITRRGGESMESSLGYVDQTGRMSAGSPMKKQTAQSL